MIQPSSIIRSNRKTLAITISKFGEVSIKAPLQASDKVINEFIQNKEKWIMDKLKSIKTNIDNFHDVITYDKMLVFGDKYKPVYSDNTHIDVDDYGKMYIPKKYKTPDKVFKMTKNWYKRIANDFIIDRAMVLAESVKLMPSKMRINDSRGRWGACTQKGEIIFNFRIAMLPPKLIDYVIFHELSHLVEMNHSSRFWSVMKAIMPDYNIARKEIKNYGFCLGLFN